MFRWHEPLLPYALGCAGGGQPACCLRSRDVPLARRIAIPEQRESRRAPLPFVPLIVFAGVLLLYVGVENALGGWLPSYAVRVHTSMQPSAVAFSFWVAEFAGRLVGTALLVRLRERALYVLCLSILIFAGVVVCLAANLSAGGILALTLLSGAAIGPVYPLILRSCWRGRGIILGWVLCLLWPAWGGRACPGLRGWFRRISGVFGRGLWFRLGGRFLCFCSRLWSPRFVPRVRLGRNFSVFFWCGVFAFLLGVLAKMVIECGVFVVKSGKKCGVVGRHFWATKNIFMETLEAAEKPFQRAWL